MDNYTLLMYPIPSFCFVPKATDYTILPFFSEFGVYKWCCQTFAYERFCNLLCLMSQRQNTITYWFLC